MDFWLVQCQREGRERHRIHDRIYHRLQDIYSTRLLLTPTLHTVCIYYVCKLWPFSTHQAQGTQQTHIVCGNLIKDKCI